MCRRVLSRRKARDGLEHTMQVIRAHPRVVRQFFEARHILGLFDLDFCGNKTASDTLHLYCVGNALRID